MTIDDEWRLVCENPDDDGPRLRYADLVEPSDPSPEAVLSRKLRHSDYIRMSIKVAQDLRRGVWVDDWRFQPAPVNVDRWAHDLLKFVAHGARESVEFFRGFPMRIEIHPAMFVEYADMIFRLGPIRHIDFCSPYDDDFQTIIDERGREVEFPLDEVLACPQLSRLDSVGFVNVKLPADAGHRIALCPHLSRCLYLDFTASYLSDESIVALAEGTHTSKMLGVMSDEVFQRFSEHQIKEEDEMGRGRYRYEFAERGKDLERRLGYVPWLHFSSGANRRFSNNVSSRLDLRWYFEQRLVPKVPPGTLPARDEWYEVQPMEYDQNWRY